MRTTLALLLFVAGCASPQPDPPEWIELFDGVSLDGWTAKISGYESGDNFGDTFRVRDGEIQVGYEAYADTFASRFGHLFYKTPYSFYRIAFDYRFFGDQISDGPGWAFRNSGLMLHGQTPESMPAEQDFPISIEMQLLGGDGSNLRPTANLCSPGTEADQNGVQIPGHCLDSSSETFHGDQWVHAEALVLGDSLIIHEVNGVEVLRYENPRIGGGNVDAHDPAQLIEGKSLTSGTLSLQSESHPVAFRNIRLLDLSGCMDPASSQYRSYFVHNDPQSCETP